MHYNKRVMTRCAQSELRDSALKDAVASVRIEGLEPSPALLSDLDNWAAGNLSLSEVGDRLFARFAAEDEEYGSLHIRRD